ncbi:MAG: PRD domain-containing protein [Spirochaetaceae bacterium]|jgi:lichenan operon transcriptional antiterminator|nr:PRD domain-containing protein [Spirochaetaceae bacterium]
MYDKQRILLTALLQTEKEWTMAKDLAVSINVSVRSVKTYINEINAAHRNLIQSSTNGYRVDKVRARHLLSVAVAESQPPSTPEERVRFIIKRLLTGTRNNLFRLCEEELFVSLDTVKKDLAIVRKRFKDFDLYLTTSGFTVTIDGSELDKRKMLSNVLYEEFSAQIFSLTAVEKAFPLHDVQFVYHTIQAVCKTHHFFVNEYSLLTLLLDVVISVDRIKKNYALPDGPAEEEPNTPERLLVQDLIRRLEAHFHITYNDLERNEITVIIASSLIKTDLDAVTMENIDRFVNADCAALIPSLTSHLESYDFIDVENGTFMCRLILHVHNLLLRLKKGYTRKNPLAEHIKTSCPMLFECAVALSGVITEKTGFILSEHETAYIALHIGSLLSTHLSVRDKVRCVLLFPGYYDYGEQLTARLTESFGASLMIRNVITQTEELKKVGSGADLVISTVKIPVFYETLCATPCVCVNPFVNERDFDAIRGQIEHIRFEKKKARLLEQLKAITSPNLFCKDKTFANEDDAIRYLSGVMIRQGYAEAGFSEEVLAREHSYSTAYENIAVPHSMKMNAKKTGMFVLLSDKPIPWGASAVNIVLLFSVNKENRSLFYDLFDNLIVLLLETPNKIKVLACDTYEAFVEAVINCL